MPFMKNHWLAALTACFVLSAGAQADDNDWMQKSISVADGGMLEFGHPEYWGKKPDLAIVEGIRTIRFGPYGTRRKPVFLIHLEAFTALEPVTAEAIRQATENEVESFKTIAVETDVSINDISGVDAAGHYFSITDRSSKIDEYDYLTLAIIGAGNLMIKCYFFSSDGAPDFGADAIQMMQSIKYLPPPPEEEGKKKR